MFECRAYGNILAVQETMPDGSFTKKNVKVIPDNEFIYKLQKTQIRAIDGAQGLKDFLDTTDFDAFKNKVYRWIMDNMKEARV